MNGLNSSHEWRWQQTHYGDHSNDNSNFGGSLSCCCGSGWREDLFCFHVLQNIQPHPNNTPQDIRVTALPTWNIEMNIRSEKKTCSGRRGGEGKGLLIHYSMWNLSCRPGQHWQNMIITLLRRILHNSEEQSGLRSLKTAGSSGWDLLFGSRSDWRLRNNPANEPHSVKEREMPCLLWRTELSDLHLEMNQRQRSTEAVRGGDVRDGPLVHPGCRLGGWVWSHPPPGNCSWSSQRGPGWDRVGRCQIKFRSSWWRSAHRNWARKMSPSV